MPSPSETILREVHARLRARPEDPSAVLRLLEHYLAGESEARDAERELVRERTLSEVEARYRAVLEVAHEGLWMLDHEGKTRLVNAALERMLGYEPGQMDGRSVYDFFDDAGRALAEKRFARRRDGVAEQNEVRLLRRDGTDVWALVSSVPILADDGTFSGAVAAVMDISALKASEERQRRAAATLGATLESIVDGILVVDGRGRIVTYNRRFAALFRVPEQALASRSLERVREHVEDQLRAPERLREREAAGAADPHATVFGVLETRDGRVLEIASQPRELHDGDLCRVWTYRDVTERVRATEMRYRAVVETALDAFITADGEGRIVGWNRTAEAIFGWREEEILGRPLTDLMPERRRAQHDRAFRQATPRGVVRRALVGEAVRRDGTEFPCEIAISSWQVGGETFLLGVLRDVSERVRAEEARAALREKVMVRDRMVSLGTLAGSLAHEINNPLAAIVTNLEIMAEELSAIAALPSASGAAEEFAQMIADSRSAAGRIASTVRALRAFVHAKEGQGDPIDVGRVADLAVRMAQNELRHRARLSTSFQPTPLVAADEARLGQAILDLLLHAARSMAEGEASRREIQIVTVTDGRGWATISVQGSGADAAAASDPAELSGLAVSRGIVAELGGELRIDPAAATLVLALPPSGAPKAVSARPLPVVLPAVSARVLVVDDDAEVGASLRRVLGGQHEIVVCDRGSDVLDRVARGERWDVILCDLMMPEMTGMDLHAELVVLAPELAERMAFMSGNAFTARSRAFLDAVPNPRFDKPFETRAVRELVATIARQARP